LPNLKALVCDGESVCFGACEAGMALSSFIGSSLGAEQSRSATDLRTTAVRPLLETLDVAAPLPALEMGHRSAMESLLDITGSRATSSRGHPNPGLQQQQAARSKLLVFSWEQAGDASEGIPLTQP